MLRPGFVGMRGQWSDDYGMHDHEYTPPTAGGFAIREEILKGVEQFCNDTYELLSQK